MKARLFAGALAFALWGGVAMADDCPKPRADAGQQMDQEGFGGSGEDLITEEDFSEDQEGIGGAGETDAFATPMTEEELRADGGDKEDKRGLTVTLGGGVEGYTGQLAPVVDPGLSWGVTASLRPTKVLGLELGYSGAANVLDAGDDFADEVRRGGADIVRNGGYAAVSVGLSSTDIQPYLLGGIGINRYDARGEAGAAGFRDDTVGTVPLGGGLRTHLGDFTADARVTASPLFSNDFATNVGDTRIFNFDSSAAAVYTGTLQLGATF